MDRPVSSGRVPTHVGLQVRDTQTQAKVNDLYYERNYGAESHDAIPPVHVTDRRIMATLDLSFGL